MIWSQIFPTSHTFPALGPFREAQEKWLTLVQAQKKLGESFHRFNSLSTQSLSKEVVKEWTPSEKNQIPFTFMDGVEKTESFLRFLDGSWMKVMRSEQYVAESGTLLEDMLKWQQAVEAWSYDWLKFFPWAPKQDIKRLIEKIHQMEQEIYELQDRLEEQEFKTPK